MWPGGERKKPKFIQVLGTSCLANQLLLCPALSVLTCPLPKSQSASEQACKLMDTRIRDRIRKLLLSLTEKPKRAKE